MKRTALKFLAVVLAAGLAVTVACKSSSDTPSGPLCKNPSAKETACSACTEEKCAAESSDLFAACGSYVSCLQNCDCSDEKCSAACAAAETESCASAIKTAPPCSACDSTCETTVTVTGPQVGTPPTGDVFGGGYSIGEACSGEVYVTGSVGYLFCDDGEWAYTTDDPALDGYVQLSVSGFDDAGFDDAGVDAGGFDAGDDTSSGDDAGFDGGASDDASDGGSETVDAGT